MFRTFSSGLFLLHGTMFTMIATTALRDFRATVKRADVDVAELEHIMSSSNAGSYAVTGRMEPAFMLGFALQLLTVGWYTAPESRAVPALAAAIGCFGLGHSCYLVKSNKLGMQIFEGEFHALFGPLTILNTGFGVLYTLVAAGTFLGWAKAKQG